MSVSITLRHEFDLSDAERLVAEAAADAVRDAYGALGTIDVDGVDYEVVNFEVNDDGDGCNVNVELERVDPESDQIAEAVAREVRSSSSFDLTVDLSGVVQDGEPA